MNLQFPFEIILRSVAVYFFILLAIRLFGKKEFTQLTIVDLVFILLISNAVQNAMVGSDSSLVGGMVAAGSLFMTNFILKIILFKDRKVSNWMQGAPVILVHDGNVIEENLKKERMTREELELAAREHGVASLEEVNLAVLEIDGNISILSKNYQNRSKKKRRAHKTMGSLN